MIWNDTAALVGLAIVAGPLLVHLLIRRHAVRVLFPAMRFVPSARAASVRLRTPSDPGLLVLRMAIVAAAAAAAAQPVLMTAARQRAWDARVARAVIVDASTSVPAAAAARRAGEASAGAFAVERFTSPDPRDALRRANEWLASAPAARREIAIVSDFQRGALDAADVAGVPPTTGIALIRAGQPNGPGGSAAVDGWRGGRWESRLSLDPAATQVTWVRRGAAAPTNLTVRSAPADRAAAERAAAAAQSFGVPAAEPPRRVDVAFAGAAAIAAGAPVTPWIASAAIAIRRSALIADTGTPVEVGERDGVMTVRSGLPASSPFAPALIRAALIASAPAVVDVESDSAALDDDVLARWRRDATSVAATLPPTNDSDGRWLWAMALLLLGIESVVRQREVSRSSLDAAGGKHADAA